MMKLRTLTLFIALTTSLLLLAQHNDYAPQVYQSKSKDTLLYRELTPLTIEEGKEYPLVLFLHGAGERGDDNIAQLKHGAAMFTNPVNREEYPSFVIIPQCPADYYWPTIQRPLDMHVDNPFPLDPEMSMPLALTKELLDKVIDEYPIDKNRIYIIGLSMGGMGTFEMTIRYPDLFAAAVPICGGVNTERFNGYESQTAFRIFHGDADVVVPVQLSRDAYTKLKEEHINVEYIEFPGVNHDSWTPAFNLPDFMEWLFNQTKQ